MGWLLEDIGGRLVGSLLNVPTLYTFRGRELVCANGRGWAVRPEFRGFAPQLINEYFNQAGAQIFINTTVGPAASPLTSIFCDRMPLGDFQTIAFWVTGYRDFAKKALQKTYGRAAGLFGRSSGCGVVAQGCADCPDTAGCLQFDRCRIRRWFRCEVRRLLERVDPAKRRQAARGSRQPLARLAFRPDPA